MLLLFREGKDMNKTKRNLQVNFCSLILSHLFANKLENKSSNYRFMFMFARIMTVTPTTDRPTVDKDHERMSCSQVS